MFYATFYWEGERRAQPSAHQLNQHAFIQRASFGGTVVRHEFKHQTEGGNRLFKNLSMNKTQSGLFGTLKKKKIHT